MKAIDFFIWMGPYKWPLILITLIIIVLIIKKSIVLLTNSENLSIESKKYLSPILFWGKLGLIVGILAQLTAIYNTLSEILDAEEINAQVVMLGFKGTFNSTIYGMFLLVITLLSWYLLDIWHKKVVK